MNRRKLLGDLLFYLALWFVGPLLFELADKSCKLDSKLVINDALSAIAIAFAIVGLRELDRGGHRKARRFIGNCVGIWIGVDLVLLGLLLLSRTSIVFDVFVYSSYPFLAFIASTFPLALYLNRNENKSGSHSLNANVG